MTHSTLAWPRAKTAAAVLDDTVDPQRQRLDALQNKEGRADDTTCAQAGMSQFAPHWTVVLLCLLGGLSCVLIWSRGAIIDLLDALLVGSATVS
ncbi:hypothetical protein D555_4046 [Bordetella holmesii 35009]|nr:hypothetical protein D555_4046 [Bordetella holmesii 35009]